MKKIVMFIALAALLTGVVSVIEAEVVRVADFTLNDLEGNPVTIGDLDGLIILDFWATWCPPCKVEIPYLQSFYDEFKDQGLRIVGISTEDVATQQRFVEQMKQDGVEITYDLLVDPNGLVTRQYGIQGIPTTIFVQPDLTQIEREVGFMPEYAVKFRQIIEDNLPEKSN